MAIDIERETLYALPDSVEFFPGNPCLATIRRWALCGCRGVVLETVVRGGRRFVSVEAIERFVVASTKRADAERSARSKREPVPA